MNEIQKKVLLVFLGLFLISIIYIPQTFTQNNLPVLTEWVLIWKIYLEINFKLLLIEWVGLIVICFGLLFYFKES
jgi:hypothetical protein